MYVLEAIGGESFLFSNNFLQGMRVLFVCNQNKYRSKTAELVFRDRCEVKSAGLYGGKLLSREDITWADTIAVMDEEQRHELVKRFPYESLQKRIVSLDISDVYGFNQETLRVALLKKAEVLFGPLVELS